MSAPTTSDPIAVTTKDGTSWVRRAVTRDGRGLYAVDGACSCPEFLMATLAELAEHGIQGMADALPVPVPVGPEPQESGGYPPALPWAALLDDEDRDEFLADLTASIVGYDGAAALAEIEKTCGTWRLVAEAQHGHNTASGPDAMTRVFAPVASLREPEGEFYPFLHRDGRVSHDMPETGGEGRG